MRLAGSFCVQFGMRRPISRSLPSVELPWVLVLLRIAQGNDEAASQRDLQGQHLAPPRDAEIALDACRSAGLSSGASRAQIAATAIDHSKRWENLVLQNGVARSLRVGEMRRTVLVRCVAGAHYVWAVRRISCT